MSQGPIVVFTDAASKGNPGPGGWGVVIVRPEWEEHRMGDKGGKKDKEKNKQQQQTKRKEQQKQKDDKRQPKAP